MRLRLPIEATLPVSERALPCRGGGGAAARLCVCAAPANEAPQHDLDGNLTDDGRWVHTWDAENRLTSMTQKVIPVAAGVSTPPQRTRLEFAYDYKNRRIAKKVFQLETSNLAPATWRLVKDLRFVYDGYQMIAELDATFATGTGVAGITPTRGVVRTYLWGPDVSGTMTGAGGVGGLLAFTFQGDSYYPISDANGNITAIHAPGIDQVIRFDYDPFGNRLTNTGPDVEICPMGFSTKYTDSETGLVDYGLRIYSPMMGRFASRDPIEERGGINLYGFVGNDPVNHWDKLGLYPGLDGHGDPISPEASMNIVTIQQRAADANYRPGPLEYGVHRNTMRFRQIRAYFDPNDGNAFVFTCKYGWIDMYHFWNSAFHTYWSGSGNVVGVGGVLIEGLQNLSEPFKDVEPSYWSPEDLQSNFLGIQFGETADAHDSPTISRYLQNLNSNSLFGGGGPKPPLSADVFYHLAAGWKRLLHDAGAVSWKNESGFVINTLRQDIEDYKRSRTLVFTPGQASAYRAKSKAAKCLCSGNSPIAKFKMR